MGLPQNQEAGLSSQQVEFRAGREALSQLRGSASLSQTEEQTRTVCCGARCCGGPCLGSLEVASLGVLKLEKGRRTRSILEDRLLQRRMGEKRKGAEEGPFAARNLCL